MLEAAKFGNFGGHDFANHLADMPAQEVTKFPRRLRCGNSPEGLQKTNSTYDGLPVGHSRRTLESCGEQSLLAGKPFFNFQPFLGRLPAVSMFDNVLRLGTQPPPANKSCLQ
jgi:hypothetical protein